jgi:hypothetical protein
MEAPLHRIDNAPDDGLAASSADNCRVTVQTDGGGGVGRDGDSRDGGYDDAGGRIVGKIEVRNVDGRNGQELVLFRNV